MQTKQIAYAILEFASLEYQDCYIIHGTKKAYRTVADIINEYSFGDNKQITNMVTLGRITEEEGHVLSEFNKILEEVAGTSSSPLWEAYYKPGRDRRCMAQKSKRLIERFKTAIKLNKEQELWSETERVAWLAEFIFKNPSWSKLRKKAKDCFYVFNEDLRIWENTFVNWSRVGLDRPEKYRSGNNDKLLDDEVLELSNGHSFCANDGSRVDRICGQGHIPIGRNPNGK